MPAKSKAQYRLMQAVAHNPKLAKKTGIPASVGEEFTSATKSYKKLPEHKKDGGGLYANIHAKRERIAHGSGEHMRKPGSKGAPTAQDFVQSAKTARRK